MNTTLIIGRSKLGEKQDLADKIFKVAAIIKQAEYRIKENFEYLKHPMCEVLPGMTEKTKTQIDLTIGAHKRLVNYYNLLVTELYL